MSRPAAPPHATPEAVRAILEAIEASDYRRAAALADGALSRGIVHPFPHVARALWLERLGRDEEALAAFRTALALAPKDVRILDAIGLCLVRLSRLGEALEAFEDAIRIAPATAAAHQRKAYALAMAGRIDEAERAYDRANRLDPRNAETLASLASIAARRGNTPRARECAERALKLDPRNASAHVALAQIEIGQRAFAAAEQRLRTAATDPRVAGYGRAVLLGLLGDALDGENRTDDAFATYAAANAERLKLHERRFAGKRRACDILEEVIAAFADCPAECWRAQDDGHADGSALAGHVFLLGFPRSGTTLLGQALESHGELVTHDEGDFLTGAAQEFLSSAAALERLSTLDGNSLAAHRDAYWRRVHDNGLNIEGKVFVDKQPFNTIKLPLIARLFPRAKVLFAIRDPRDVVLSAFRRQLDIDLLTFEFLTLEGAARLYDCFMRFGELGRSRLPLAFFDCRYEVLVADFDGCTRAVCDFIGVKWSESMRDFAIAARRLEVQKASAGQLRRGLYADAAGQWRRYANHLEPALPHLDRWIVRFGYEGGRLNR